MTYQLHPLSALFPRLEGGEFEALKADLKANGLQQPIILHDGLILDGGNRYRACVESGIEPKFDKFAGGDPVQFVLSANLHRRHLSPGQQAAVVAAAQDWARAHVAGNNQFAVKLGGPATLPDLSTVADRAAQSGASERTQRMADKVARADPELAKQVAHGKVSLPQAVAKVEGKAPPPARPKKAADAQATPAAQAPTTAASPLTIPEPPTDDGEPSEEEIAAAMASDAADAQALQVLLDADDKLAAAAEEIKRLNALVSILTQRNAGLIEQANEAVKAAKMWRRKHDALAKKVAT